MLALLLPVLLIGDLLGEQVTTAIHWALGHGFLSEWMSRVLAEVEVSTGATRGSGWGD